MRIVIWKQVTGSGKKSLESGNRGRRVTCNFLTFFGTIIHSYKLCCVQVCCILPKLVGAARFDGTWPVVQVLLSFSMNRLFTITVMVFLNIRLSFTQRQLVYFACYVFICEGFFLRVRWERLLDKYVFKVISLDVCGNCLVWQHLRSIATFCVLKSKRN